MIECVYTSESPGELLEVSTLLEIQTSVGSKAWGSDCMCPSGDSDGTGPWTVFGSWSPMPSFDLTVWDNKTQHGTCPTSWGKWVGPLHRLCGLNPKLILLFQATYSQIIKMGQEAWPRVWLWFSPALGFLLIPKLWLGMVPVSGAWRGRDSRAEILQGKENCNGLFSRSTGVSQWRAPGSKDDSDTSFIFHFRRKGRERLPSKGGDRVEKGQLSLEGAWLRKSHTIQHPEDRGTKTKLNLSSIFLETLPQSLLNPTPPEPLKPRDSLLLFPLPTISSLRSQNCSIYASNVLIKIIDWDVPIGGRE